MTASSLIALLQATPEIASLLGTYQSAPAVHLQVMPRGYKFPAIVVHRYMGTRDQDFQGPVSVEESNFQLDIYGDTATDCEAVTDACRTFLTGYTGTLADGTVVQGTYKEQDRDMPFLANADIKSLAFRSLLGFRFVTQV